MDYKKTLAALLLVLGLSSGATGVAQAMDATASETGASLFQLSEVSTTVTEIAGGDHKCGGGKCGAGMCGGDKGDKHKDDAHADADKGEHKCGAGMCGSDKGHKHEKGDKHDAPKAKH